MNGAEAQLRLFCVLETCSRVEFYKDLVITFSHFFRRVNSDVENCNGRQGRDQEHDQRRCEHLDAGSGC
jgi:glutamyl-tRNA reductase